MQRSRERCSELQSTGRPGATTGRFGRRDWLVAALSVGAELSLPHSALAAPALLVIVHPGVKVGLVAEDLPALFTTTRLFYDRSQRVVPFNLPPRTLIRSDFDRRILGMNPEEVARYWVDRKVRGGSPPPTQVPSVEVMAKIVERIPGAIGYVPQGARLGAVRVALRLG